MKEQKKHMRAGGKWTIAIALALVGVILSLILWTRINPRTVGTSSGSTSTAQRGMMTQTNEEGQITVKVTWRGRNAGPAFAVEMDNHMVDLDGYDLRQLAVLPTDQGKEVQPIGWNAPMGGHHRNGMLSFPSAFPDGSPVFGPNTRTFELVIHNIGNVPERTFQWTL